MYEKIIILSTILLTSLPSCFNSYTYDQRIDPFMSFKVHSHIAHNSHKKNHHGHPPRAFNVNFFGAKANGNDDSQAFVKAWEAACLSTGIVFVVVPRNRAYTLKPVKFFGPCKPFLIVFKIYGKIEAWRNPLEYKERRLWIVFRNVSNLRVEGGGSIDGNGKFWWPKSCKINPQLPCMGAPTAVTFVECNKLRVSNARLHLLPPKPQATIISGIHQILRAKLLGLDKLEQSSSPTSTTPPISTYLTFWFGYFQYH